MPSMERERKLLQQSVANRRRHPRPDEALRRTVRAGPYGRRGVDFRGEPFRFLSGLLLGIGLCFWSTLPSIEVRTGRFRLLTLLVVIGGSGRLIGLGLTGFPSFFMVGGLVVELFVTPSLPVADPRRQPLCRGIRSRGGMTNARSLRNCPDKAGLSAYHVVE